MTRTLEFLVYWPYWLQFEQRPASFNTMIILIGILVGLLLGLTGAGGSILAVPLLMGGLGWPITQAATTSLLAVSAAATIGAGMAWKHAYVRYRAASLMAFVGIPVSPLGIYAADNLEPTSLQLIFAAILTAVALRMYIQAGATAEDSKVLRASVSGEGHSSKAKIGSINTSTGRLVWTWPVAAALSAIGAIAGILSGLLGVGGGFVIVPALRATLPLSMHSAVATSLMTIALISQGAFFSGLFQGRQTNWLIALPFVAGAISGMYLGRIVSPHISGQKLQRGFALLAITVSLAMASHALHLLD